MPFQPKQLTESTFKGFVDRLHRFCKSTPATSWPPKRAWAQEAVAVALGFPNHHAARRAIANATLEKRAIKFSEERWTIQPEGGFSASSMLSTLANDVPLDIPLRSLQSSLMLLGKSAHRARELEALVALAHRTEMPLLAVQGEGSTQMSFPKGFTTHSFYSFAGYGNAVPCILDSGEPEKILEALVALMDDMGHDNRMWRERAISLLSAVIFALVYMRDHGGQTLHIDSIRDHLILENLEHLSRQRNLPPHVLSSLRSYLRSLPGYQEGEARQSGATRNQHGYLQMQFARIFGAIRDPLMLTRQTAIRLDRESKESRALKTVMNEWVRRYEKGVIILDGLDQHSALYGWLLESHSRLGEARHGMVVGMTGLADLPEAPINQRLLDRIDHWVVMSGYPSAARDSSVLLKQQNPHAYL